MEREKQIGMYRELAKRGNEEEGMIKKREREREEGIRKTVGKRAIHQKSPEPPST